MFPGLLNFFYATLQFHVPWFFHGVLGKIDIPVEKIEDTKGQRKEYTGIRVYGTGACQHHVGWDGRSLKEDGIASLGSLEHRGPSPTA